MQTIQKIKKLKKGPTLQNSGKQCNKMQNMPKLKKKTIQKRLDILEMLKLLKVRKEGKKYQKCEGKKGKNL